VRYGAVAVVRTYEELAQMLWGLLVRPEVAQELGRRAREFYEMNRGVVDRVFLEVVRRIGA
jgi:hypothetical protein